MTDKVHQVQSNVAQDLSRSPVSLKELAAHLRLSPTTVSLVLNNSPVANSIPEDTKRRVLDAALAFNYRPNLVAKSLRAQRSYTLGVMVPELSDGYSAMVLSGIEDHLLREGYFYFVASHRHKEKLIGQYPGMFFQRRVEGIIAVDTPYDQRLPIPIVAVSGHHPVEGVTTISLNHAKAARLALDHLIQLGHSKIAFIKGQQFSSDTEIRWQAICSEAAALGLTIEPSLVAQLEGDSPSPEVGYIAAKHLLATGIRFTALFAFNDVSAIGAVSAFREAGLMVPDDISVLGFDDIYNAAFFSPALTTIRQPLKEMGRLAAYTVLERIAAGPDQTCETELIVEPELVVRQSTAAARTTN